MKMALALAEKGRGFTSPNPMVGAVLVKEGKVVGQGWHRAVGEAHAEVEAIRDAGDHAEGATLYVTLEPCNHTGRTPPCAEKVLTAGIREVVMAMEDPNPHVTGGGARFLAERGIAVRKGVCEAEARRLNESFIKFIQTGRPFVVMKSAATLDGRTATRTGDSKWITGPAARRFVHLLRHEADAILVGIGTVKADNPQLTTRLEHLKGRDPIRVILDTDLSIDAGAEVLRQNPSGTDTLIVTGPVVCKEKKQRLEQQGVRVIQTEKTSGGIDLKDLMSRLGEMQVTRLLIEGGSRVHASALNSGIVDKVHLFFAPKILGGDDGYPICRGQGPERMNQSISLTDIRVLRFDDDVMIEGYIG